MDGAARHTAAVPVPNTVQTASLGAHAAQEGWAPPGETVCVASCTGASTLGTGRRAVPAQPMLCRLAHPCALRSPGDPGASAGRPHPGTARTPARAAPGTPSACLVGLHSPHPRAVRRKCLWLKPGRGRGRSVFHILNLRPDFGEGGTGSWLSAGSGWPGQGHSGDDAGSQLATAGPSGARNAAAGRNTQAPGTARQGTLSAPCREQVPSGSGTKHVGFRWWEPRPSLSGPHDPRKRRGHGRTPHPGRGCLGSGLLGP